MLRTVVLYGESLVLSSIAASLEKNAEVRVVPVERSLPGAEAGLKSLRADVVIFDAASMGAGLGVRLCQTYPGMLVIGINLEADQALLLSAQGSEVLTADGLIRLMMKFQPNDRRQSDEH